MLIKNMPNKETKLPHTLPSDMHALLQKIPLIQKAWNACTPLGKNEWICWVTSAKKQETREKRMEVMCSKLRQGERRPCCWPGCPHR